MNDRRRTFDDLYASSIDPWKFRTSSYEKGKYLATMRALPEPRYYTAVEAGCSIGELSRLLATRCDVFYGVDVSGIAIAEARVRNSDQFNMKFSVAELPGGWPEVKADLIVLSEFLYFLSKDEIYNLAMVIVQNWKPAGDCVVVSFLGTISGGLLQGAESAEHLIDALGARTRARTVLKNAYDGYRIDVVRNC